jgi:hypothetical protein
MYLPERTHEHYTKVSAHFEFSTRPIRPMDERARGDARPEEPILNPRSQGRASANGEMSRESKNRETAPLSLRMRLVRLSLGNC